MQFVVLMSLAVMARALAAATDAPQIVLVETQVMATAALFSKALTPARVAIFIGRDIDAALDTIVQHAQKPRCRCCWRWR